MENLLSKIHQWFNLPYRLHTKISGTGPTIIMLHGIATSSASWTRLIPLLNPSYRCITIDLLGFGESPKPDWYSYTPDDHIRNIEYSIKKLRLKEPFILVGHSMGSLLALHYANKHPEKISQLYLLSPPIYLSKKEALKARKVWRDALYARAYRYIRTHKEITLKGVRGLKSLVLKNNPFSVTESTWIAFSKSLEECIEKQNVIDDIEHVQCPVKICYGTRDQLLIKSNIMSLTARKDVELRKLKAGHLINDTYARAVAEEIYNTARDD